MTDTTRTYTATGRVTDLDCSGLLCPLPVYQAALVLNSLAEGEVLRLVATDPGALRDIPAMARQRGDTLIEVLEEGGTHVFLLEKGSQG